MTASCDFGAGCLVGGLSGSRGGGTKRDGFGGAKGAGFLLGRGQGSGIKVVGGVTKRDLTVLMDREWGGEGADRDRWARVFLKPHSYMINTEIFRHFVE